MNSPQLPDEQGMFDVPRGYVMIKLHRSLTFEGIDVLAAAGQLAGVPADAELNTLRIERRTDHNGHPQYEVHVDWQKGRP